MSRDPVSQLHLEVVAAPVAPQERIQTLDILRGWAVFGIILADVDIFFKITPGTDHLLNELHKLFVVDKFWPLFSFLFGLGFAMQTTRAESRQIIYASDSGSEYPGSSPGLPANFSLHCNQMRGSRFLPFDGFDHTVTIETAEEYERRPINSLVDTAVGGVVLETGPYAAAHRSKPVAPIPG